MSIRERYHSPRTPTGVGLGLRAEFLGAAHEDREALASKLAFVEVCPENYMQRGGRNRRLFEELAPHVPVITHGVMMSLGSLDPFDDDYFAALRTFLHEYGGDWHSDHLCFSGHAGALLHDLLPLPLDEATALRFAARVREAQDRLGMQLAVENVSYYLPMGQARLSEAEFARIVCEEADCGLLLDVNNVFVNARNHGADPREVLWSLPTERACQIHLAGHVQEGPRLIDHHGAAVCDEVWALYREALADLGPIPTLIEWDTHIPELDEVLDQADLARAILFEAIAEPEQESA
ncbi:MAG: DUF692 domain-containing protein [Myxococcales bacterium]|nr:DUF692 domain-containing protein [Myxococcales bacterium]